MNMKKSIAGVVAGAMAVSAMAAVVSADQDAISLTYDLKTYVKNTSKTFAKATVVATYQGSLISAQSIVDRKITFGADNKFVTGGDVYKQSNKIGNAGTGVAGMCDFEFTARPYKNVANEDGVEEGYQVFKATGDKGNHDGAWITDNLCEYTSISTDKKVFNMPIAVPGDSTMNKFDLAKYDLLALGYSTAENAATIGYDLDEIDANTCQFVKEDGTVEEKSYGVRDAVAKMTYLLPPVVQLNKANGWNWEASLNNEQANNVSEYYYLTTLMGDVEMSAEVFSWGFYYGNGSDKKSTITNKDCATALISDPTTIAVGDFSAGAVEEDVFPFKSTLNPSIKGDDKIDSVYVKKTGNNENDVIAALESRKAGDNYYTRPLAVINDAIANHDNVVFTFTSYNGYVGTEKSHLFNQWVNPDQGYTYKTSDGDWYNPNFGQHLYTNVKDKYSLFDTTEYDMYGSYSSAWGINLFTGAIVVNSGITMQLNDTDAFNWGNNTLSFDWFDITDEGKITDAKTFLKSMLLYTPVDWYWDSLTVVVSDDEDETVDAGEGLDGEGEILEDEEPEEIVEEPEVEEVEETEAAPVETAPSPATGNAPVALAVIPVALAAAAVVAKKRG